MLQILPSVFPPVSLDVFALVHKAELLQVGIFFLIHLFAQEIVLLKKLEIEVTN